MFFDQFDRIYIVNLPTRPDRRREMQQQMRQIGLEDDQRVSYFDAVKTDGPGPFARTGSHGAYLSHLAILKEQIGKGETVLILQDDCDFVPNATATQVLAEWDILYGGYHELDPEDLHNSDIIGAHCMAFRPMIIGPLVDFLEAVYAGSLRAEVQPDSEASNAPKAPPIDGAIVWFRRSHPEVRTVFQRISYQRSSRTDIGQRRLLDRIPVPALATIIRFFLRRYRRLRLELRLQP